MVIDKQSQEEKSNGALMGSIIIIIILVVGGVYFWRTSMKGKLRPPLPNQDIASTPDVSSNP